MILFFCHCSYHTLLRDHLKEPMAELVSHFFFSFSQFGTIVLGTGQAAIMTAIVASLPLGKWLRPELLTTLLLANLLTSIYLFCLESFVFEAADDQVAGYLLVVAAFLPAYRAY